MTDSTLDNDIKQKKPASKKGLVIRLVLLALVVAIIVGLRLSPLGRLITLKEIQKNIGFLQEQVNRFYLLTVIAFILIYFASVTFSFPIATYLTLTAGFLYGPIFGTIYVNIGATLGAAANFLLARYLFGRRLQERYADQLSRFNREIKSNGQFYLLTMRLIPVFPFFLINILSGLTGVTFITFFWTTAVGIIPGSFVYTFFGKQLSTISSASDLMTPRIFIALSLMALLAIVPVLVKKFILKKRA